jgi:TldD protein
MKHINRRSFLKTSAAAGGALLVTPYLDGNIFASPVISPNGYFLSEFGIDDALCSELLTKALSRGGDFADLYFEHTLNNWLVLEDGKVNQSYGVVKLGVGIRTVKGDQIGYGYTEVLDKKSMLSAASTAASMVNEKAITAPTGFKTLNSNNYYPIIRPFEDVALKTKLPLVKAINDHCFAQSPLVKKVQATFHDSMKRVMVITSDGIKTEDVLPRSYLSALTVAEKDGRKEQAWYNIGGRRDFDFYNMTTPKQVAEEVVKRTLTAFDAIQPPAGEMPVVLGPGVTGILLHEAIGHGYGSRFQPERYFYL